MKKLVIITAFAVALLLVGNVNSTAQAKFGYFDLDKVVSLIARHFQNRYFDG
jgi:hypothetical protein